MSDVRDWDVLPENNTQIDGVYIGEHCPARNVNNALRAIMAATRSYQIANDAAVAAETDIARSYADAAGEAADAANRAMSTANAARTAAETAAGKATTAANVVMAAAETVMATAEATAEAAARQAAEIAVEEATAAANMAMSTAETAREAAEDAAAAAAQSEDNAAAAAEMATTYLFNHGVFGFRTKALLDADLGHDANSLAFVTNDPAPENNNWYIKVGASGSGSWLASDFRPATKAEVQTLSAGVANLATTAARLSDRLTKVEIREAETLPLSIAQIDEIMGREVTADA